MTKPIDITAALAVPGWSTDAELTWLATMASTRARILELGSWQGRSAIAMADNTAGRVVCVDTWNGSGAEHDQWLAGKDKNWLIMEFWRHVGHRTNINAWRTTSLEAAEESKGGLLYDMVFIDADHTEASVRADIHSWRPLLAPGGLLCGHDINWPGVAAAVNALCPGFQRGPGSLWWVQ